MINKTLIDNLRTTLRRREKLGERIVLNVTFFRGEIKELLLDHAPISDLSQLNKIVQNTPYERVKVDAIDLNNGKKVVKTQIFTLIDPQAEENEGLSGIELSRVERFLAKKEKDKQYEELQRDNTEYTTYIGELEDEIEKLEGVLEELQQGESSKNSFSNFVPLLQGVAKSFGLDQGLTEALSGLAGNTEHTRLPSNDASCIIDGPLDSEGQSASQKEYNKKAEIVQIMINSIMEKDFAFVSKLFLLYSEVEKSPHILPNLLTHTFQISTDESRI